MAIIDARERMREAGQELEAARLCKSPLGRSEHMLNAQRLMLEAIAQVATVAGIAPLPPPEPEEESDE